MHPGEEPAIALAPGTPRRRALDQALAEVDAGLKIPSTAWRREFSLLLGLERVLSEDEPKLVDGTVLSAHQVDALSGTLTALLAEALRSTSENGGGGGNGRSAASPELLASAETVSYTHLDVYKRQVRVPADLTGLAEVLFLRVERQHQPLTLTAHVDQEIPLVHRLSLIHI